MEKNFDGIAAMHTVGGINKLNETHKNIIRDELRDMGIDTVIVNSGEGSYDRVKKDEPIITAYPTSGTKEQGIILGKPQDFQLGAGGVMAERTLASLSSKLDKYIPVLNSHEMIGISRSKYYQYQLFPDLIPRTVAIEADQAVAPEMLEPLIGDDFYVKADYSASSNYAIPACRSEVGAAIAGMRADFAANEQKNNNVRKNKRIIVQENVFGQKWDELVGINEDYQKLLKVENGEEVELRISCYRDKLDNISDGQRYYALGRVRGGKIGDKCAQIDQSSVPKEAWDIAKEVSDKLMKVTDSKAAYIVVDVVKGISPETSEMRYFVREINGENPTMANPITEQPDGMMQRHLLANAMATVIRSENMSK